jgi:hypothetical protein
MRHAKPTHFWLGLLLAHGALLVASATAAERSAISQRNAGFFEVSGPEVAWVNEVDSRAAEIRAGFAPLLDLPERYPTPVYIRVAAAAATGDGDFRLGIEPAGLVSLAITPGPRTTDSELRHALARALLVRHGAWLGGYSTDLAVPAWLEEAGVAGALVVAQPSMSESLGREAARHGPIPLAWMLGGGSVEAFPAWQANAWFLAQFLRAEMGRDAWGALVRDSLRSGIDPGVAVARTVGRGGANPEIAWSAAFFNLAARHGGPGQSPQESYRAVTRSARFVFRAGGKDTIFPWERLWFWRESDPVRREMEARARHLSTLAPTAHPFFINAYASLQDACRALLVADAEGWGAAVAAYEDDLAEGVEMSFAAGNALDASTTR